VWDGQRWDREGGAAGAMMAAHKVALAIREEAKALKQGRGSNAEDRVARLFAWALQSGNQSKARAMIDAAQSYLTKRVTVLDANPMLAACTNGTIVLKRETTYLRPSEREDLMTRRLGVPFVTGTECPQWMKFLERVMPDSDMREFLQRIAGYCLTGSSEEQCCFIHYGTGANGKSTFINVLRHIMGDYAMNSPVSTFLAKREGAGGSEASPDIARLPGVRLLTASEPPEGARLDEGQVKAMTSNEVVTARHLNQGFFEFRPCFKLMISTNHYPRIRGTDAGIWRRIRLVPWTVRITDEEKDMHLEEKLIAEAPGILQWMIDGAEQWRQRGLDPPAKAKAAVEDYKAAQDPVGEFLSARCTITGEYLRPGTDKPYQVTAKAMLASYKQWCEEEGLDVMTNNAFVAKLLGKGITKKKSNGNSVYVGVALNADLDKPDQGGLV
jgi:putative DNA primase/helicase